MNVKFACISNKICLLFHYLPMTYPLLKDYLQKKVKKWAFSEHLFEKIDHHIKLWGKILILSMTKKSAEEIANLLVSKWYKAYYLHSEIVTIERFEIINKLKSWKIDILVGINLLREWIDLPEVSLIAILDADSEWFLRSATALIQTIWRAARNPNSEVVLYADRFTKSILKALWVTYHRRGIQDKHNKKNKIKPTSIISNIKTLASAKDDNVPVVDQFQNRNKKKLKRMTKKEKEIILESLREQLDQAVKNWEFEKAADIRDQIKELSV